MILNCDNVFTFESSRYCKTSLIAGYYRYSQNYVYICNRPPPLFSCAPFWSDLSSHSTQTTIYFLRKLPPTSQTWIRDSLQHIQKRICQFWDRSMRIAIFLRAHFRKRPLTRYRTYYPSGYYSTKKHIPIVQLKDTQIFDSHTCYSSKVYFAITKHAPRTGRPCAADIYRCR